MAKKPVKIDVKPVIVTANSKLSMSDSILMGLHDVNMNPYVLGLAYILLNLGGRFMTMSVTPGQEAFLQNIVFRPLLLFAIMFIGTRNIVVAFWLTLVIIFCLHYLFNENSSWYLLQTFNVNSAPTV